MKRYKYSFTLIVFLLCNVGYAQQKPYFDEGEDPKPTGAKWKLVKGMSDEFNGKKS